MLEAGEVGPAQGELSKAILGGEHGTLAQYDITLVYLTTSPPCVNESLMI